MRKIKKINGYLVVKFNDREKREYEGTALGEYGVIDAELYTGHLDIDRGAMEYDDAGTLEEAIELARGLESEVEIINESPTCIAIVESDDRFSEKEVEPQLMINDWESSLAKQIESRHYPDTDERTAAHALYGYKVALYELGFLTEDECFVSPGTFGKYDIPTALPRKPEELLAYICDKVCKERTPGRTQPELDAICAKCAIERLASEGRRREFQAREKSTGELNKLIDELRAEKVDSVAKRLEFETSGFIRALVASKTISEQSGEVFIASLSEAIAARGKMTEKDTFRNLDPKIRNDPFIRRLYRLGLALERDCPENDCTIYRNIFQMAQELDDALDDAAGHPAFVLRKGLREQVNTLREMYRENYAVGEYLRRCGHDRIEIIKAPGSTAGEIADIISKHCTPTIPKACDRLACRKCWLSWLTTGATISEPCTGILEPKEGDHENREPLDWEPRLVSIFGIKINGKRFSSKELMAYVGQKILVKYTPEKADARTLDGNRIGELTPFRE